MAWKNPTSSFTTTPTPKRAPSVGAALAAGLLSCLLTSPSASAHPLGENSINQYVLVRAQPDGLHLSYRLDFAETPAIPELTAIAADREKYLADRAEEYAARLTITLNDKEIPPQLTAKDLKITTDPTTHRQTLLLMFDYLIPTPPVTPIHVSISIGNYTRIPGWREAAALAADKLWITDNDRKVKAKVLDQRAETGDTGHDWTLTFTVDSSPTTQPK